MGWVQDPLSGEWYASGKQPIRATTLKGAFGFSRRRALAERPLAAVAIETMPDEVREEAVEKAEKTDMNDRVDMVQATPNAYCHTPPCWRQLQSRQTVCLNSAVDALQEWAKVGGRAYMKFQELDANGDKALDAEEVGGMRAAVHASFDLSSH